MVQKKTTWMVYATHWNFEESRWCFEMCLIFSPRSLGMMIQFDEHFFSTGWLKTTKTVIDGCSLKLMGRAL